MCGGPHFGLFIGRGGSGYRSNVLFVRICLLQLVHETCDFCTANLRIMGITHVPVRFQFQ